VQADQHADTHISQFCARMYADVDGCAASIRSQLREYIERSELVMPRNWMLSDQLVEAPPQWKHVSIAQM
jgi:hypothetical protein